MKKFIILTISHLLFGLAGFAVGVYTLPIRTAPDAPSANDVAAAVQAAEYKGRFERELEGSDFLHWGEGNISVSNKFITLEGEISPGPDYKLYLSPQFVQTEAEFNRLKPDMIRIGDVKTFENFIVPVPESVDIKAFNTVVVWCESFGEFITAATYQ